MIKFKKYIQEARGKQAPKCKPAKEKQYKGYTISVVPIDDTFRWTVQTGKFPSGYADTKEDALAAAKQYIEKNYKMNEMSEMNEEYMTEKADFFAQHGIKKQAGSIGFSEKEQKWYGWSHRAIYGFKVGDGCKAGDCHAATIKVGRTCKTLDDCKEFAKAFADSVS
jgi:hypothetical protein